MQQVRVTRCVEMGSVLTESLEPKVSKAVQVYDSMVRLNDSCRSHIERATADVRPKMESVLALEADLGRWLTVLDKRVETAQLRSAHRDFGLAFYAMSCGLYRQAFSSLRSFLEVSVAAIFLSTAELKRRQWVSGDIDISWSSMNSADDGIYSAAYIAAFCPSAVSERLGMRESMRTVYRRCSEYIHGNVGTTNLLPESIEYNSVIVDEWLAAAKDAVCCVIHCLMVRYFDEFDANQRYRVEATLEENFAHLVSVRTLLDLPMEDVSR